ncbi:TatD family hydrolase, partial [Clostridium perfringens]
HRYSGEISTLEKYIELGCYFTISVDIGYSEKTNEVLDKIPLNRLLIETDGPTALEWVNGEYGYPMAIIDVAKKVSNYKNIELNELLKNIEGNYIRIIS